MNSEDFHIYFIRNNFQGDEFIQSLRNQMFDNRQIGILVDQENEKKKWNSINNSENIKIPNTLFIERWFSFHKNIQERNVIVVSNYLGKDEFLIGQISKGSKFYSHQKNNDLKIFNLENATIFSRSEFQIFNSLIPQQTTLSPVLKRKEFILSKYFNYELDILMKNMSDSSIELMCMEWLRSDFAPKEYKIKSQLLKIGGNYAKVDIYGLTENVEKIAVQVSFTDNLKVLNKKASDLLSFNADKYVIFCSIDHCFNENIKLITLEKVFEDFKNDDFYLKMLKQLINS